MNSNVERIKRYLQKYRGLWVFLIILLISNPSSAQEKDNKKKIDAAKTIINDVKLSDTDPLASILQMHKGKVVYVDVWATWCLPCLFEMPNSRKLREKLIGENVVFVYICVNSNDEKRWRKLITSKRIAGDNYLLSAEQSAALLQKYTIAGIPRYMLFDKNGDAVSEDAKRPGEPIVLKTIRELLESK
ncbi:thiol-disulfide isomerase/thioredoxin [Pedobacter sp. UYP24]